MGNVLDSIYFFLILVIVLIVCVWVWLHRCTIERQLSTLLIACRRNNSPIKRPCRQQKRISVMSESSSCALSQIEEDICSSEPSYCSRRRRSRHSHSRERHCRCRHLCPPPPCSPSTPIPTPTPTPPPCSPRTPIDDCNDFQAIMIDGELPVDQTVYEGTIYVIGGEPNVIYAYDSNGVRIGRFTHTRGQLRYMETVPTGLRIVDSRSAAFIGTPGNETTINFSPE